MRQSLGDGPVAIIKRDWLCFGTESRQGSHPLDRDGFALNEISAMASGCTGHSAIAAAQHRWARLAPWGRRSWPQPRASAADCQSPRLDRRVRCRRAFVETLRRVAASWPPPRACVSRGHARLFSSSWRLGARQDARLRAQRRPPRHSRFAARCRRAAAEPQTQVERARLQSHTPPRRERPVREAVTSPARAAPTKRRPTPVVTRCRRRTGSRRAASAYARLARAVSAATSASRSVPSSPTRAVACRRSVARPPRPGRARRPAPRRRRAGFLRSPHLSWGGCGGGARDAPRRHLFRSAHDELEFPRAQLEVRLEGAFHLA